jgi:hypothetical protein
MALIKINGRLKHFDCDSIEVKKVSNGRWEVTYNEDRKFIVVGGRESGGHRHEWFCYHPEFYGEQWISTNSMVAAIKMGVAY